MLISKIRKTLIFSGISFVIAGLLFNQEKSNSRSFALFFAPTEHPYIETSINNIAERFIIDLGGSFYLKLNEDLISIFEDKEFESKKQYVNINGVTSEENQYFVKDKKFMDIKFNKLFLIPNRKIDDSSDEIDFEYETEFSKTVKIANNATSLIGHRLLSGFNVLFDFQKNKLKIFKLGIIPLFDFPYRFVNFSEKIPIHHEFNKGVICHVKTEYGIKKFLIDTGSPISMMKCSELQFSKNPNNQFKFIKLKMLEIGKKKFNDVKLLHIDNLPISQVDGILGMDFLYNKTLFIDFHNSHMYLR
jgi:hypothetical protein